METNKQKRKRDPKTGRYVTNGTSEVARLRKEVAELKTQLAIKMELEEAHYTLLCDKDNKIRDLLTENYRLKNRRFWARVFNK